MRGSQIAAVNLGATNGKPRVTGPRRSDEVPWTDVCMTGRMNGQYGIKYSTPEVWEHNTMDYGTCLPYGQGDSSNTRGLDGVGRVRSSEFFFL